MAEPVVRVATPEALRDAIGPRSDSDRALILVGGADLTSADDLARLDAFFLALARHAEDAGLTVVDGGTDSGVMRLIGLARTTIRAHFQLIGVLPEGVLSRPTRAGLPITLAPGHTEFVLIPGNTFGDESRWLFDTADYISGAASPTLVVGGGELTRREAEERIAAGAPVIVVAGSGRTADTMASDPALRGSGRLRVIELDAHADFDHAFAPNAR